MFGSTLELQSTSEAKKIIQNSKKRDSSLLTFLRRNDENSNTKGETLPDDMRVFRFDLVESFLSAGIPLSKIDHIRSFLEKYGHRLTSHGHLSELIPSVIEKEKTTLKTELSVLSVCPIHTTRVQWRIAVFHWNK